MVGDADSSGDDNDGSKYSNDNNNGDASDRDDDYQFGYAHRGFYHYWSMFVMD